MTFTDIFKKSFLEGFSNTDINTYTAVSAMMAACFIALYIFVVYRTVTKKTFYSKTFNIAIALVALITCAVIITIQSNIVVSLGMVGALSIVRFRTAVKDPMDLVFFYWSIVVGIICGVGLAEIAVLLSLMVTAGIILLDHIPVAKAPMMLIVNSSHLDIEPKLLKIVGKYAKHSTVKSRNMKQNALDIIIELRTDAGDKLLKEVLAVKGATSASLLAHDGEVTF